MSDTIIKADRGFLPRAEALRGLAALSVLAFHATSLVFDLVTTGLAPVVVFFVLSGFVLSKSLDRGPIISTFLRHRAFRLLPAAIVTVGLMTFLYWQFGFYTGFLPSFDPLNVVLNALLVRSDINGPMWSLTVEVAAIPVILLCHRAFQTAGYLPLAVLAFILFGLSFWGPYVHLLGGVTNLAPLYSFVFGVMAYFYRSAQQPNAVSGRAAQIIEAAALLLIFVAGCRKQTGYTILAETISASALLVVVASTNHPTLLGKLLDTTAIRFLGRISYSFYLLHMIGLSVALRTLPAMPDLPYALALFLFGAIVTIPMAWLMWRWVEVPFIELGKSRQFQRYKSA